MDWKTLKLNVKGDRTDLQFFTNFPKCAYFTLQTFLLDISTS